MKFKFVLALLLLQSGSTRAFGQQPPSWTVSPEPIVSIGLIDGDEAYLFTKVMASVTDDAGRIYVADMRQYRVSIYSSSGVFVRHIGTAGTGPGEFWGLTSIRVVEDQLRVLDPAQRRIVVFDTSGVHISTTQMQSGDEGRLGPTFFHGENVFAVAGSGLNATGHILADTLMLSIYNSAGSYLRPVGHVLDSPRLGHEYRGALSFPYLPFGRGPSMHGNGRAVVFGQGAQNSIHVVRPDGDVERVALTLPEVVVTSDMRRTYSSNLIRDANPEDQERLRRFLDLAEFPETLPSFDKLRIDLAGFVWVHPYSLPWDPSSEWLILGEQGQVIATVTLPPMFSPEEIQTDSILGVRRDEDGYQYVEQYELNRQ